MQHLSCWGWSRFVPGVSVGPVPVGRPQEATWPHTDTLKHMHMLTGVQRCTHVLLGTHPRPYMHTRVHTHPGSLPRTLHHGCPSLVGGLITPWNCPSVQNSFFRHHRPTGHRKAQNSHPGASLPQ